MEEKCKCEDGGENTHKASISKALGGLEVTNQGGIGPVVLLISIMDQVSHVLLVADDLLVLNVQLIEAVENRLKHRGTHCSRSGSRNSAGGPTSGLQERVAEHHDPK